MTLFISKEPTCPPGYDTLKGSLTDGRACYGMANASINDYGMCEDLALDQLRRPAFPTSSYEANLLKRKMK